MMLSWSMLVPSRKCSRMVKILAMAQLYFRRFVTVLITLFRALMYVLLIGKTSSGFWISWDTLLWCMYCSFGRQVLASEYLETLYFDVCIAHWEDKFWLLNILRHFTLMYVLLIWKTSSGFWISWDILLWCMYCSFGRQVLASEYLETLYFEILICLYIKFHVNRCKLVKLLNKCTEAKYNICVYLKLH